MDERKEYEAFSYVYDKDQELLKSEKGSLLRFMRQEVVQNQEFLDRIAQLEAENLQLQEELHLHQVQLARSNALIQEGLEDKRRAQEEQRALQQDAEAQCDIFAESDLTALQLRASQLSEQLFQEQQAAAGLEARLQQALAEAERLREATSLSLAAETERGTAALQRKNE